MKYTLKHRLIGAAFLAAIAVIFLPGFFKEKQDNEISTKSQIPVRPGIVPVEFNAPKPVPDIVPAPAPETMFVPEETPEQAINSSAPGSLPASTKSSPAIAPVQKDVPAMPLNAEDLPNAWVVQVGSFSTKEAANKVRDDLQVDGFKAYVRTVPNGAATISRVYVGPKLDKAEALTMKSQIDKRLKVKSMVMQFRP